MARIALILTLSALALPASAQTCGEVLDADEIATANIDSLQQGRVLECVHVPSRKRWTLQRAGGKWLVDCPIPALGSLSQRMEPVPGCVKADIEMYRAEADTL